MSDEPDKCPYTKDGEHCSCYNWETPVATATNEKATSSSLNRSPALLLSHHIQYMIRIVLQWLG